MNSGPATATVPDRRERQSAWADGALASHSARQLALSTSLAKGGPLLQGKRILVTGVATHESIAFAVAQLAQLLGAEVVLTSYGRVSRITRRAADHLPEPPEILELDVNVPADFRRLGDTLAERWERIDGVLHAIAYAPPGAMCGNFLAASAQETEQAFRASAFSLSALVAGLAPMLGPGASIVALDFDGSRAWPGYDWMGVCKAALEAVGRYLAQSLGPRGIRVNLVSCGPLRTMSAAGVPTFDALVDGFNARAPLGWDSGAPPLVAGPVCFLLSDLAAAISGEILHVDGGFNAIGMALAHPEGQSVPTDNPLSGT
jgi:enoyl ACP reductase